MYRCDKCKETIDGAPKKVATGYKRDSKGALTKDRLGEADLCSSCYLEYVKHVGDVVEARGGFRYAFLVQGCESHE